MKVQEALLQQTPGQIVVLTSSSLLTSSACKSLWPSPKITRRVSLPQFEPIAGEKLRPVEVYGVFVKKIFPK